MLKQESYVPWKPLSGNDDKPHPIAICEPINLAHAFRKPPEYQLAAPSHSNISTLQDETVRMICDAFLKYRCFILGDATGVGKGRIIAAVIRESYTINQEVKVVWVSANTRLSVDAEHELVSVGLKTSFQTCVAFTSYTSLLNSKNFKHIQEWCANSPKIIVLDECHLLRNVAKISKVLDMFLCSIGDNYNLLYSSATAVSCPRHLLYMKRIPMYGHESAPFTTQDEMINVLKIHGNVMMELFAIQLCNMGIYVSRQLDFQNIVVETRYVALTQRMQSVYDLCANSLSNLNVFGGCGHQAFFQKLITAFKVDESIVCAHEWLEKGYAVIISLVNTGEAYEKRRDENENNDGGCLEFLKKVGVSFDVIDEIHSLFELLNPIHSILGHFGRDRVAELTGRSGVHIQQEVDDFQSGRKDIAILSRAGGVGISLHNTIENPKKRAHIVLEFPWSVEDFLQQLGRTHRTSSLDPPTYIVMNTEIPSEERFIHSIVVKLKSLGALIKGDRFACNTYLHVQEWTPGMRRSFALRMAVALRINEIHDIPHMSFAEASHVVSKNHRTSRELERLFTLHLVHHDDEYTHSNNKTPLENIIGAAAVFFPQDVIPMVHPWSIETHSQHKSIFKKRVKTFLLCHSSWATRNTLGKLPEQLVIEIIAMMASQHTGQQLCSVAKACIEHGLKLEQLGSTSQNTILNRMLGMEIHVQKIIKNLFSEYATCDAKGTDTFLAYMQRQTGSGIATNIKDQVLYGDRLFLRIEYAEIQSPDPPLDATFFIHPSGRIAWMYNGYIVFADDPTLYPLDNSWEYDLECRGYRPSNVERWNTAVCRRSVLIRRRCNNLPTRYIFMVNNALQEWERSLKCVIRLPPLNSLPMGSVGLLVNVLF